MADEPINVLSRRLSKFFTNTDSTNFDYQRYREREATEQVLYRSDQKSFKCVCLSHRLGSTSPSTMGHSYDSVKLEEGGIKKAKIKIWFVGDDEFMNGPNPNPFTTIDEGLKIIYISMAREAIITQTYANISYKDLLTVEKRGDDYYVVEHHHDELDIVREITDTTGPTKSSDVFKGKNYPITKLLSKFTPLNLPNNINFLAKSYDLDNTIPNKPNNDIQINTLHKDFKPFAKAFVYKAWKSLGIKIRVNSGYRSVAYQQQMYDRWIAGTKQYQSKNAKPAKPGTSHHNTGTAIDFNPTLPSGKELGKSFNNSKSEWKKSGLVQLGKDLGMRWGGEFSTNYDPIHFDIGDNRLSKSRRREMLKQAKNNNIDVRTISV